MSGGLRSTYDKVVSANGPAQMLTYSFWGVLMAGMFMGVCDECFTHELLIFWGVVSGSVAIATVWFPLAWLRNLLLLDVVISAYIMVVFLMHEPHVTEFVYMTMTNDGIRTRSTDSGHTMSDWFHASALIWMTLHAVYLADLTNRQLLEKKRFEA